MPPSLEGPQPAGQGNNGHHVYWIVLKRLLRNIMCEFRMNLTETVFADLWFKHTLFTMWTSWRPCFLEGFFERSLVFWCNLWGILRLLWDIWMTF